MSQTILENIHIGSPTLDESTQLYTFVLENNNAPMSFVSSLEYQLSIGECSQMVPIPKREELKLFHEIYKELKRIFLENHVKWFENKFSETELDTLFRSYLVPNISENRIDLQVKVDDALMNSLKTSNNENSYVAGVPSFLFEKIVLNLENEKMECVVLINKFDCKTWPKNSDATLGKEETSEKSNINEIVPSQNSKDDVDECPGKDFEKQEEQQVSENDPVEEVVVNEENADYLEEVDFDGEDLERVNVNFNNEEYYVIYKYLTRLVNETLHKELRGVMNEKEVNMKTVNLSEIIDDSDCESEISDSESYDSDLNNHI